MGDLTPSLADLITLWISDKYTDISMGDPQTYDPTSRRVGRYHGAFVMSVCDDKVIIRNMIKPIMAANPDFFEILREGIDKAKGDIDFFEHTQHAFNN